MRVYGMFVQVVNTQFPDAHADGWRFEGISSSAEVLAQFRERVQEDIEATKGKDVSTVGYRVVLINK